MTDHEHFERAWKAVETNERFRTGEIQAFNWSDIKSLLLGCVSLGLLAKRHKMESFGEWMVDNHLDLALTIYERRNKNDQL